MVFDEYARYYDLLYQDKDYQGETKYIEGLIQKYHSQAKTILDLGCGTGRHAELLARKGYEVHGVDVSRKMLEKADARAASLSNLSFSQSDIGKLHLNRKFDAVTALFHVVSYQTRQDELRNTIERVYAHLKQGGVFIFDCWYGPAVFALKPEVRVKRLENDSARVTRIAEPEWKENENIVEVNYDVFICEKESGRISEIEEKHAMRYLFKNEVEQMLETSRLELIDCFEFMTDLPLSKGTWSACFIARKD